MTVCLYKQYRYDTNLYLTNSDIGHISVIYQNNSIEKVSYSLGNISRTSLNVLVNCFTIYAHSYTVAYMLKA